MAEMKPSYYAVIPAEVRYDKNLTDKAKLFYGEITALSNATGVCFAGNEYFEKLYVMSKSQVIRTIKNLEEQGYIIVSRAAQSRTIKLTNRVAKMTPQGCKNDTQQGCKNDTHNNTSINNKINNIYSADFSAWYDSYPRKEDKQRAWKNYQRCLKQGYTPEQLIRARDKYLATTEQMGYEIKYIKNPANFLGRDGFFVDYIAADQAPELPSENKEQDEIEEAFSDGWYSKQRSEAAI